MRNKRAFMKRMILAGSLVILATGSVEAIHPKETRDKEKPEEKPVQYVYRTRPGGSGPYLANRGGGCEELSPVPSALGELLSRDQHKVHIYISKKGRVSRIEEPYSWETSFRKVGYLSETTLGDGLAIHLMVHGHPCTLSLEERQILQERVTGKRNRLIALEDTHGALVRSFAGDLSSFPDLEVLSTTLLPKEVSMLKHAPNLKQLTLYFQHSYKWRFSRFLFDKRQDGIVDCQALGECGKLERVSILCSNGWGEVRPNSSPVKGFLHLDAFFQCPRLLSTQNNIYFNIHGVPIRLSQLHDQLRDPQGLRHLAPVISFSAAQQG